MEERKKPEIIYFLSSEDLDYILEDQKVELSPEQKKALCEYMRENMRLPWYAEIERLFEKWYYEATIEIPQNIAKEIQSILYQESEGDITEKFLTKFPDGSTAIIGFCTVLGTYLIKPMLQTGEEVHVLPVRIELTGRYDFIHRNKKYTVNIIAV
jgi:hypothetical protein